MLLKNISRKTNIQYFFIFVLSTLGLFKLLFENKSNPSSNQFFPCFEQPYFTILENHFLYVKIFTFLLFIGNAILLNYILRKHKLIEINKYYPAFFYLLFFLSFLKTTLAIPLFINTLIILFLLPIFLNISKKNYKLQHGFIFGFFCSLISLIYPSFLFFILLLYIILIINGFHDWRSFLIPLLGVLVFNIYFFSILYFIGYSDYNFFFDFYSNLMSFKFLQINYTNIFQLFIYGCFFIFYLSFLYLIVSKVSKMNIFVRKKYYFLLLSSAFGLFFIFFSTSSYCIGIMFFITILAVMGGICETFIKKRLLYNVLIFILLLSIIFNYLSSYFVCLNLTIV